MDAPQAITLRADSAGSIQATSTSLTAPRATPVTMGAPLNTSLIQNSEDITISGGQFTSAAGNVTVHHHYHSYSDRQTTSISPLMHLVDDTFSESEIYSHQLLRRKRGFPLYDPEPQPVPEEYQKCGVAIGDVGRITPEGSFDFFFNIYLEADHPINNNDVPENFSPLQRYKSRDLYDRPYPPGSHVSTSSVQRQDAGPSNFPGGLFIFKCRAPQGAVLALPDGSHLQKLRHLESLRTYAAAHAESWFKYVNGPRGRGFDGSLYLVTGWEKAPTWGIASFHSVDDSLQLSFTPAAADSRYRWTGNPAETKDHNLSSTDEPTWNQTTFVHGLSISLGRGIWTRLFETVQISETDAESRLGRGPTSFASSSQGSSLLSRVLGFFSKKTTTGESDEGENVVLADFPSISQIFHPGQLINNYILEKASEATVVMSHDDDWYTILDDGDTASQTHTVFEFLQTISDQSDITHANGATFLRAMSSSSENELVNPSGIVLSQSEVTKPLVPTTPTIIPVYSTLLSFLADYTSNEISDLRTVLDDSLLSVAPESAFTAVTESLKRRETLLELASKHGLINLPNLQAALQTDDEWIAPLFVSIFDSKSAEEAVLCLQDGPAQNFLDVVQNALDKGYFLAKHSQTARRIIWKLSELSDKLPSSLFITGVSDVEKHAGSFGDIFRASYQNKLVALKRMRHSLEVDSHLVHSKFCREALIWNMLRHPHILPLLGIDRDILSSSNSLCMVSPWMKHGTVMKYLQDYGRTTVDKLLYEIALGLEYLHSVNIVHGDLRGSNILVDDGRCACLVGFALSEIIGDNDVDDNRSGNARWMAPELISPDHFGGQFARTPASDVYAFGCVCLELYTGRPPFSELSEAAALIKIFTGERPERPSGHSSMSDILWQHVTQFWAQEPSTRPETRLVVENMRRINTDNDQEQGIIIRPKKKGKEKEMAAEFSPAYDEDN